MTLPCDHIVKVGNDWSDGFLVGKAAALSDWSLRKEIDDPEFKKLCERLYYRNWARKMRERDPERARENCRRWRRRNPKRRKELERKQRRKKREANPRRFRCRECGVDIIVVHGRSRKFCSRRCRNGWHGPRRTDRNRGLRQMDIRSTILGILRHGEWMSKRDILGAAPHLKPQSVSTTLGALAASGSISKRGNTRTMRYTRGTPCQTEP